MEEKKTKTTKPAVKKTAVKKEMAAKVAAPKKTVSTQSKEAAVVAKQQKTASKKETTAKELSVKILGLDGSTKGTVKLPVEVFGAKIVPALMAQAVRVYLANQRSGTHATKTRSTVNGTTKKIYRQKGTGRARHGAKKAPIFVGGGITFGPQPRDHSLSMPQKMRKSALFSSLSSQFNDNKIVVVENVDNVTGKTKEVFGAFKAWNLLNKKKKADKVLFVIANNTESSKRAVRNIDGVTVRKVSDLNTYEVLQSNHVVFVQNSLELLAGGKK